MSSHVYKKLEEIFQQQVFEMNISRMKKEVYIPYMMNDAVENYLILTNCRIKGQYIQNFNGEISGEIVEEQNACALIVRQGNENTFTVWFDQIQEKSMLYRYHEIGHFWVKGDEQWRQMVYMLGTVYDKYLYMGESACNEIEIELLPLMEFSPIRFFSPIHESLELEYKNSKEGTRLAYQFAKKAGCKKLSFFIKLYEKCPLQIVKNYLIHILKTMEAVTFYDLIRKRLWEASASYSARDYGPDRNAEIIKKRRQTEIAFGEAGLAGEYPYFYNEKLQILAVEEHPFTRMEHANFEFRIQYMISEGKHDYINAGFFGKNGYVEKNLNAIIEKIKNEK